MATTQNTYTGNGTNKLFNITFPYLDTTDIDVFLNGTLQTVTTQYTFANATTVEFVTAPANGATVLLSRSTDDTALQATFFPGSSIKAADLNYNFDQVLYLSQETANVAQTSNSAVVAATTAATAAAASAATAVTVANTASANSITAINSASAANTVSAGAVTTANNAVTTANSAVTTANSAVTTANTAVTTANSATVTANSAVAAVGNALLYTIVANVAAIPSSPANNAAVEITNSTGIESFSPLSGKPAGFVGSSGLSVRIIYQSTGSTWSWVQYFASDPENRYLGKGGGTLTGVLAVTAGTAALPGIAISGDTNTGIFNPGADQLAISTNGTSRLVVDASGNVNIDSNTFYVDAANNRVGIGTTNPDELFVVAGSGPTIRIFANQNTKARLRLSQTNVANCDIYNPANSTSLAFSTDAGTTQHMTLDSSGRLLVGTSSARGNLYNGGYAPSVQFETVGTNLQTRGLSLAYNNATDTGGPLLHFITSRGSTAGSNTLVVSGDELGGLSFTGADGTRPIQGASINAYVDGTPGDLDMPGRLVFSTTADGAASPTERLRITSKGEIGLGGANYGTFGQVLTSNGVGLAPTWQSPTLTVPAGSVSWFAGNTAPSGYLSCDGSAINRTTYAILFAAIGTTHGVGNGSTTFNIPDLRGEFIRGLDGGRGIDSGRTLGSAQAQSYQSHNHAITDPGHFHTSISSDGQLSPASNDTTPGEFGAKNIYENTTSQVTGITINNNGSTETRPRNIALLPIIKY
jgi:microcystin-dependent protein